MDLDLARTFLAIIETGSFIRAAKLLHMSQTTISARIRSLEGQLGRRLFVRSKAGAVPIAAGENFLQYASTLVQVWERARHQIAVPAGHSTVVTLGTELSLWNPFIVNWLVWMKANAPDIALRVSVELPATLMSRILDGVLDIAIMYMPQNRPGLVIERLFDEKLVMVTTGADPRRRANSDYVYVDWGAEFASGHGRLFPSLGNPAISVGLGPLGLGYILEAGGSGYFRQRAVRPHLKSRKLRLVRGAPEFIHPAYLV